MGALFQIKTTYFRNPILNTSKFSFSPRQGLDFCSRCRIISNNVIVEEFNSLSLITLQLCSEI